MTPEPCHRENSTLLSPKCNRAFSLFPHFPSAHGAKAICDAFIRSREDYLGWRAKEIRVHIVNTAATRCHPVLVSAQWRKMVVRKGGPA